MPQFKSCDRCGNPLPPDRPRLKVCTGCRRRQSRAKRHNLDADTLAQIARQQGNLCPACDRPILPGEATAVDHWHGCCDGETSCGRCIRGLTHRKCNSGLGLFDDDAAKLEAAARYLRTMNAAVEARLAQHSSRRYDGDRGEWVTT